MSAPRLYAISDLHLERAPNRVALEQLPAYPEDYLILAGDVCTGLELFVGAMELLSSRWRQVIWVPGNHELWTVSSEDRVLEGEGKYLELVRICRRFGVLTPEDEYAVFPSSDGGVRIAPLFLLYDYSFAPDGMDPEQARAWAESADTICTDEVMLSTDPYPTREAWCAVRCSQTAERLRAAARESSLILVNHFPLRRDLARLPLVPRFTPWCGTRRTEDWHTRFCAKVVVTGHLHIRHTAWRDGVRFEEVSLGYQRQWDRRRGLESYLRFIL